MSLAGESDYIALCVTDASGPKMRYVVERIIIDKTSYGDRFSVGKLLPFSGMPIETNVSYGEKAILFCYRQKQSNNKIAVRGVLFFRNNITPGLGITVEDALNQIQKVKGLSESFK